jgi:cell division septation protein DedD
MADESFREIQLSGKQLIALFMAAAVVLIVTFLSGVLVGRGVRSQQEPAASVESAQAQGGAVDPTATTPKPAAAPEKPAAAPEKPALPTTPPPQPEEDPTLYTRGQASPAPASAPTGATEASARAAPDAAATPGGGEPPGTGFYLKVVAYRTKAQADKVASSLSGKGYGAYVVPVTGNKGTALYSVRVGKFPTRKEAEAVKRRLEQEEQQNPSIAR